MYIHIVPARALSSKHSPSSLNLATDTYLKLL